MNKYLKIVSFLLLTLKITLIGQEFDTSVIKNASYCISKDTEDRNIKTYYYYTSKGEYLTKIDCDERDFGYSYHIELSKIKEKLDKTAAKPQPIYYKIRYHRGFKGSWGYRIYFFDKNENLLHWYWYDEKKKLISKIRETFWISEITGKIYRENDIKPTNEWFKGEDIHSYYQFPINRLVFTKAYPDFPLDLSVVEENASVKFDDWSSHGAEFLGKYKKGE